jgi:hypothetical protein
MTLGVSALCYLLRVKQGYKSITGGVLYRLIQSPNRTVIQCLTDDSLLFFKADAEQANRINDVLRDYEKGT